MGAYSPLAPPGILKKSGSPFNDKLNPLNRIWNLYPDRLKETYRETDDEKHAEYNQFLPFSPANNLGDFIGCDSREG